MKCRYLQIKSKNLEEIQNQTAIGKIEKRSKYQKRSKDRKNIERAKKSKYKRENKNPNKNWKI